MEQDLFAEIGLVNELAKELTVEDVIKLKLFIKVPAALCEENCDGGSFLLAMRNWDKFNPYEFQQALTSLQRKDLLPIAIKLPWLCVLEPTGESELLTEKLSMKTFVSLLRTEITIKEWKIVAIIISSYLRGNNYFDNIITACLEARLISKEMKVLERLFTQIGRMDVYVKIREYKSMFVAMSDEEFAFKLKKELCLQAKEILEWEGKLRRFVEITNKKVQQILGKSDSVNLASVYVDLTIVREEPRLVNLADETTYNEIAFLRKIANKEIEIVPVDFTEELRTYESSNNEIWCLIGNPGCGKTFLSKRIALRFGNSELTQISYTIAIPCRNSDWHSMESTRVEEEKAVTSEFVQKWLCLGLPVASDWAKELAKHLAKSDGEGLLLIIDGLDEFTKEISFEKSLLYMLLTRQTLHQSTIILTTRPGAWTDISSRHTLNIDRYYQVLGFSPENRDIYFEKQIVDLKRLGVCRNLLSRYDEMSQLSLIPVNASLFAALLKDESVTIQTLTQLYTELTCYLIRRQLTRMALKELAKVIKLELFDQCVLDCLYKIGRIALLGVASRELTSTETVTMTINHVEIECHCLGLAHEFSTKEAVGIVKKVWAFAHLTMQEFTSAVFLKSTSWTNQCLSVRYISDSDEHFSVYKMVVRFLCGLLMERSAALLIILIRKLMPATIDNLPFYHQMGFDLTVLLSYTGWFEFSKKYFDLIPIVNESNCAYIHNALKLILPSSVSLYLNSRLLPVSPNEWLCFFQSLQLVHHIKLISVDTSHISLEQFESLMKDIKTCPLDQLAILFQQDEEPIRVKIISYTELINETALNPRTRISIDLSDCKIEDLTGIDLFSSTNQHINSVRLYESECSNELLHQLANNVISSQHFQYLSIDKSEHADIILPALTQATQIKGLYITESLSVDSKRLIKELVPKLTQLTEIDYQYYSLLPHLAHLTGLTYLEMKSGNELLSANLLQVLNTNCNTLSVLVLWSLEDIGFQRWTEFLSALQCCVNIVMLQLSLTSISSDDSSQWAPTLRCLPSLLSVWFFQVTLSDAGVLAVCQGLAKHPTIKLLSIQDCGQSSQSCEALTNLIPTTRQLKILGVSHLSLPDPVPLETLKLVTEEYSVLEIF